MADIVSHLDPDSDAEYELESEEGSLFTGSVVFIGMMTMMWAAVVFSYFYLRTLDHAGLWRPAGLRPPYLLGALIGLGVVLGAVLLSYGAHKVREGLAFEWELSAWLTVGCGATAMGFQIWQLTRLGFAPGTSGYTSVFIGFAMLNILFILSGTLWAEFLAARALRLARYDEPDSFLGVSGLPEVRAWRASLRGCLYFWWYMALMSIFFWVLFYLL